MNDCIFCKIVAGQIPSWRVLEDEHCVAFLDIGPLARGHTLLIPRRHVEFLWDLDVPTASALASNLPRLSRALIEATSAEGINVLQSNGRVSGQVIPHVHFHLIPRRTGDGLGYRWPSRAYAEGEAEGIQAAIRAALT